MGKRLINIRYDVFESNSSSTCSLIIGTVDDYNKSIKGEALIDCREDSFITIDQAKERLVKEYLHGKEDLKQIENGSMSWREATDGDITTLGDWMEDEYLETDYKTYTSPSGDKLIILEKYGYDG